MKKTLIGITVMAIGMTCGLAMAKSSDPTGNCHLLIDHTYHLWQKPDQTYHNCTYADAKIEHNIKHDKLKWSFVGGVNKFTGHKCRDLHSFVSIDDSSCHVAGDQDEFTADRGSVHGTIYAHTNPGDNPSMSLTLSDGEKAFIDLPFVK